MNNRMFQIILAGFLLVVVLSPDSALATQGHSGVEGTHVHQIAHLFFIFSMGTFIYWLRRKDLVRMQGWRILQYSAFFFILWNIDAFTVHLLDEQLQAVVVTKVNSLYLTIQAPDGYEWLAYVYYFCKLDHLFCVPAMVLLFLALKTILKESYQLKVQGGETR